MDRLKASVLSRDDLESIKTNGYQIQTVNIKAQLFLKKSFHDHSLKGISIVVEKAEYFDGTETAIRQINLVWAKLGLSDILQVFLQADILGVPQAIKGFDKSDFCEVLSIHSKCQS
jgi:hypothetical protein